MREKFNNAYQALKETFGYKNLMQTPRVEKVIVATGTGRMDNKAKLALIPDRLAKITGQKALPTPAKQSIASFKLRAGDIVGYKVTLRGQRMENFLDKLVHIALPQTRDFHGFNTTTIDEMGNCTLGIREHTIFPECTDEELENVFGLAVTIVTTAKTKPEAEALLRHLGLPLQV